MAQPVQLCAPAEAFVGRLDAATLATDVHEICRRVKSALAEFIDSGAEKLHDSFLTPAQRGYARRLLHRGHGGDYSVAVMVWQPGQGTPIHDHAGKWCVEGVCRGNIEVINYDPVGSPAADTVNFAPTTRVVDGPGRIGVLIPPTEYHRIRNSGLDVAVTIHIYQGEMLWCHAFHPVGGGGYRRERCTLPYTDS